MRLAVVAGRLGAAVVGWWIAGSAVFVVWAMWKDRADEWLTGRIVARALIDARYRQTMTGYGESADG